jgi:hypothetical protein
VSHCGLLLSRWYVAALANHFVRRMLEFEWGAKGRIVMLALHLQLVIVGISDADARPFSFVEAAIAVKIESDRAT